MRNDYACEECRGTGISECFNCGHEITCKECEGSGFDGTKIDVAAFKEAEAELFGRGASWEWVEYKDIYDMGNAIGRQSDKHKLAYKDFARGPGPAPVAGPGPGG